MIELISKRDLEAWCFIGRIQGTLKAIDCGLIDGDTALEQIREDLKRFDEKVNQPEMVR